MIQKCRLPICDGMEFLGCCVGVVVGVSEGVKV